MARISVAMATYNGEQHIRQQLDSLARQTHAPLELVITDDGSTDATLRIAAEFAQSAPFPVCIHRNPERLRHTRNFLRAASLCQGEWIAFCDQDDVWLDHKLGRVAEEIDRHPGAVLVQHSAFMVNEDLSSTGVLVPNLTADAVLPPLWKTGFVRNASYFGFTMAFDASLLDLCETIPVPEGRLYNGEEGQENNFGHDKYIHFLSQIFGDIVQIKEPLALYRRHDTATSIAFNNPESFQTESAEDGILSKILLIRTKKQEQLIKWEQQNRQIANILGNARIKEPLRKRHAELAMRMYRDRANLFAERCALYKGDRIGRLKTLMKLLRISAYKSRREGGLGSAGLISDLLKIAL